MIALGPPRALRSRCFLLAIALGAALLRCDPDAAAATSESDAVFEARVKEAIDRGVSFLHGAVQDQKFGKMHFTSSYPLGIRALPAYALLEAGVPASAPLMKQLFAQMERLPLDRVYSVAVYAMALDAYLRAAGRGEEAGTGGRTGVGGGKSGGSARARLEHLIDWLVQARSVGRGVWGYTPIGKGKPLEWVDFSNTQFAVLGLQVGVRNEVRIPDAVFEEICFAFEKNGARRLDGEVDLHCGGGGWWTDSGLAPGPLVEGKTGVAGTGPIELRQGGFQLRGAPREWQYKPTWGASSEREFVFASFSMTAAATSSLMIAREALARAKELPEKRRAEVDSLIAGGVIALKSSFHTLAPVVFGSIFNNYYYDLYSFEKAMDLGGIATFGGIDWYRVQAVELLAAQRNDGAWGSAASGKDLEHDIVSTSFALLFLRRATRNLRIAPADPIFTGAGGGKGTGGVREGRVYVASRNGMVELKELFALLAAERTSQYLAIAKEVIQA
ncbi:MAG: hypothetical protein L0Z55_05630, partial [Planctomycetes bacterium]|nr:hypothetical protein [Planctomycetota bacterium]